MELNIVLQIELINCSIKFTLTLYLTYKDMGNICAFVFGFGFCFWFFFSSENMYTKTCNGTAMFTCNLATI